MLNNSGINQPPRRVYVQYLNPEILSIYGANRLTKKELLSKSLQLTAYALLVSEDTIIMPASYLFEVGIIESFLKNIDVLRAAAILQIASPTPDIHLFSFQKRKEYRDELSLFPGYVEEEHSVIKKPLIWIPRVKQSASGHITTIWRDELYQPKGLWNRLLQRRTSRELRSPSKLERQIERVPNRLAERAFIYRYAKPFLPRSPTLAEETEIALMISKAYLESYLDEYCAFILVDTPIGRLDCDLEQFDAGGNIRTVSFRGIADYFTTLNIRHYVDNRLLKWQDLLELRRNGMFRHLMDLFFLNLSDSNRFLDSAILRSRYQPSFDYSKHRGKKLLQGIIDELYKFLDKIEPFLQNYVPFSEATSIRTRPTQISLFVGDDEVANKNDVFLIHGRDHTANEDMKTLLRSAGLVPIDWEEAVRWTGKLSPSVFEVISIAIPRVQAVICLFTPDETAQLRPELMRAGDADDAGPQPRPNVLVETGMAFAVHPQKTVIVQIGHVRPISDLAGLHVLRFDGSPKSREDLINRLRQAGLVPRSSDYLSVRLNYFSV